MKVSSLFSLTVPLSRSSSSTAVPSSPRSPETELLASDSSRSPGPSTDGPSTDCVHNIYMYRHHERYSTHHHVPQFSRLGFDSCIYSTVQRQLYKSTRGTRERHAGYARGTCRVCMCMCFYFLFLNYRGYNKGFSV